MSFGTQILLLQETFFEDCRQICINVVRSDLRSAAFISLNSAALARALQIQRVYILTFIKLSHRLSADTNTRKKPPQRFFSELIIIFSGACECADRLGGNVIAPDFNPDVT